MMRNISKSLPFAQMAPEQPKVLMYNIEQDVRGRKLRRYLQREGIAVKEVQTVEYLESLGCLLGLPMYPKNGLFNMGRTFSEEMLFLAGFSPGLLDDFLGFFANEGLAPVKLKAMLTAHNISWNSLQLYEELARERKSLKKNT